MPPRTHDLVRLLQLTPAHVSEEQELFLRRLGQYYIETRYPDEMRALVRDVEKPLAEKYLKRSQEVISWLDRLLKSK